MSRSARDAFTLIELVIVIAIIAIFLGLLLPANRRVRVAAARTQCQNNLKQLMLAMHTYHSMGGSTNPDEQSFPSGCISPGARPEERLSWMVALLPYLEEDNVYRQLDLDKGYSGNLPVARSRIKTFLCPDAGAEAMADAVTSYIAMSGIGLDAASQPAGTSGNGFMGYDRVTSLTLIKDGTSHTIALMETRFNLGPWARGGSSNLRGFDPTDLPLCGDQRQFGGHKSGATAGMADGSVRFILSSIDPAKLAGAITIDGGEPFNLD
jgi:prepilin-type N-terminal cleavage/methylation domain-containing protein